MVRKSKTGKQHQSKTLSKEINIYENKQPNGQWLKQIVFSLPIIGDEELYMSLDKGKPVETVVLMTKK